MGVQHLKKIILLGSNPGNASPDTTAFHPDTRSRKILDQWFLNIHADISFANVRDQRTPNNRPLRVSEIRACLPWVRRKTDGFDKVVALGKTASKALELLGDVEFVEMPHPSGMNRLLNDADYVAKKVKELEEYVGKV